MTKENTCFFTGHRDLPCDSRQLFQKTLDTITALYKDGCKNFICGGAIGFDTLAAYAVLELKKSFDDVKLHLYLPCADQKKYFNDAQSERYDYIMSVCDSSKVLYPRYVRGCMHARNRAMADASSHCVAYCLKSTGGSAYTVKYATSQGIDVIFVK